MAPLQFAYRTQKAIGVFDAAPSYEPLPGFTRPEGNLRCCVYSPCGRYFAWAAPDGVTAVSAADGKPVAHLPVPNVYELSFSPAGTFLSTWERPAKDEAGDATKNLKVWRTVEADASALREPVGQFVQKSQNGWALQYTDDERFCARLVTNEVQFYETGDLHTVWNRLRVEGVADFALAPGPSHSVAAFIPERKGQPAAVKVFSVPQFTAPLSQKTFFKGDKVQLKWNKQGTSILVLAQTEVDKSNKSYYGETNLYLLSVNGSFDARVSLDKEGPIHDVAWSPNSREFGVVYGYMPAKTTIFNHRAAVTQSLPMGPRNTIIFSPTGRFALVAGFGNLAGQMDVYDMERDFRKVCTIESGNPSVCQWSPDSRFIMTATTSPRLRVDNGVKLWHVTGPIMYNEDMVELYNVMWRPQAETEAATDPLAPVPAPHSSATAYLGTIKTPSKPAGAYRPPGARGLATPLHFKREDEGGAAHVVGNGAPSLGPNGFGPRARRAVPGAEFVDAPTGPAAASVPGAEGTGAEGGDDGLSKAALKNKKKRNNKKAKENAGAGSGGGAGTGDATGARPDGNGASLAPPHREHGPGSGNEGRSPERRGGNGPGQGQGHRHHRSLSRNNAGNRARSNTARAQQQQHQQGGASLQGQNQGQGQYGNGGYNPGYGQGQGYGHSHHGQGQPSPLGGAPVNGAAAAAAAQDGSLSPQGDGGPQAKKMRSLQKKVRAIEDLEMRLAGGEKLEDTQIKKIATKGSVLRELEALERAG